jgi:glycosyltransferase involved in cell wall biosynthesis
MKKFTSRRWLLTYGWKLRADLIHCHQVWGWTLALSFVVGIGKKLVITVHDQMCLAKYKNDSWEDRIAFRWLSKSKNVLWVAVSANVLGQLVELGVNEQQIRVIPAFLSPVLSLGWENTLPEPIQKFCSTHYPILTVYGWRLSLDSQGDDLYGFDKSIELVHQLVHDYPQIGLIALVPLIQSPAEQEYYAVLSSKIKEWKLTENILFYTQPLPEAMPLWAKSTIYLRPTTTDGDAISVREALSLKVPVVASDASPRPAGTLVFKRRDLADMTRLVRQVLAEPQLYPHLNGHLVVEDYFNEIIAVYRELQS